MTEIDHTGTLEKSVWIQDAEGWVEVKNQAVLVWENALLRVYEHEVTVYQGGPTYRFPIVQIGERRVALLFYQSEPVDETVEGFKVHLQSTRS